MLLGKNLPHCWLDYGKNSGNVSAVVIQFAEQCLGQDFFKLPETAKILRLLDRSAKGISFRGNTSVAEKIMSLPELTGPKRLTTFIDILHELSLAKAQHTLSKIDYTLRAETSRFNRINVVYDYVYQNFKENIALEQVAGLVHMNVSAFCHYFKKSTGKTFSQFVNEMRIGFACKLLIETDLTVSEISFRSGYNGLSNFNKAFKSITTHSPLEYRKQFRMS